MPNDLMLLNTLCSKTTPCFLQRDAAGKRAVYAMIRSVTLIRYVEMAKCAIIRFYRPMGRPQLSIQNSIFWASPYAVTVIIIS